MNALNVYKSQVEEETEGENLKKLKPIKILFNTFNSSNI